MKDVYLALDLTIDVVETLIRLQEELDRQMPDGVEVRWNDPRHIQIGLKYFGEVEDDLVPFICDAMRRFARPLFGFEVGVQGIDAFPNLDEPRLIYVQFDRDSAEVLGLIQKTVEKEMAELGFANDVRPFEAHVVLGRVRTPASVSLVSMSKAFTDRSLGRCHIRDVALFESKLSPVGPTYSVIERIPLGG